MTLDPLYMLLSVLRSPAEKLCYEQLEVIVTFIRTQTSIVPEIGIICGSGLGGLADQLQKEHPIVTLPYHDIPNFPTCNGMCCV